MDNGKSLQVIEASPAWPVSLCFGSWLSFASPPLMALTAAQGHTAAAPQQPQHYLSDPALGAARQAPPTLSSLLKADPCDGSAAPIPSTARRRTCMATQRDFAVPLRSQEGSAELFLRDVCGIPEHLVDAVMITAVAWRVTPGGRPLIDRRRRCRCERNMPLVSQYLQEHCNIPAGAPCLHSHLHVHAHAHPT